MAYDEPNKEFELRHPPNLTVPEGGVPEIHHPRKPPEASRFFTCTKPQFPISSLHTKKLRCWILGHRYIEHYEPPFDPCFRCQECNRCIYYRSLLRKRDKVLKNLVSLTVRTSANDTPGRYRTLEDRFTALAVRKLLYGREPEHGVHTEQTETKE